MQIRIVSRGSLLDYQKQTESADCEAFADVVVFPFGGVGEVSYDRELKGESGYFEAAATLSKRARVTVVCGCITDTRGHKRKSAIVAQQGKIVGVSDMLYAVDEESSSGVTLSVYETAVGKMGVVVAGDIRAYETVRALALCGCDFLVCVQERYQNVHSALIRAWAYCLGVPVVLSADGYAGAADESGTLAFSSPQDVSQLEIIPSKEYHLVQTRRRGKR